MTRRIEYAPGELLGAHGCKYLEEREGRITARGKVNRRALFQCPCEENFEAAIGDVKGNYQKSCGCLNRKWSGLSVRGGKDCPIYIVWRNMIRRCYDPSQHNYHRYGGRGIKVCPEWREDFPAFREFALSEGWEDGLQVDRWDNDCDYEPDNVRFATHKENQNNRGDNRLCMLDGERTSFAEAARVLNISYSTIHRWADGVGTNRFPNRLWFTNLEWDIDWYADFYLSELPA